MNKKSLLISIIVIVVIALGGAAYYFIFMKAAKPIVWDGSYKMTGELACEGNFPNLTTIPMNTTITVSSNKVVDEATNKSFDIDKRGKVTEIIQQIQNGLSADIKAEYQFFQEKGVNKFTANGTINMSATQNNTEYSSICTGTMAGIKQ